MIQRIQTLYLAFVFLFNLGFVFTPLFSKISDDPSAWLSSIHYAALAFSGILSVYAIFLFRDRIKQMQWITYGIYFQAIALGSAIGVVLSLGGFGTYLWDEALSWMLLVLSLVSLFLAKAGVKKDHDLVKSMDRIR
jgi:hypothetical protein